VRRETPEEMAAGERRVCRLFVENTGVRRWHPPGVWHGSVVRLEVSTDAGTHVRVDLREKVIEKRRCHFIFELTAPLDRDFLEVELRLVRDHPWFRDRYGLLLHRQRIAIRG